MVHEEQLGLRKRMSFSRIDETLGMPDLIEIQKESYERFAKQGLKEVLDEFSPITDYSGNLSMYFDDYEIDFANPKKTIEECRQYDATYSAALRVHVVLTRKDSDEPRASSVYMGEFPIMTPQGTFIINGAERVIVSQLVRSPGAYYSHEIDKTGKHLYSAQAIPNRGSWLEFETDSNEYLYAKLNRQRKLPITIFIRALLERGDDDEIIELFGDEARLRATMQKDIYTARISKTKEKIENKQTALIALYKHLKPGESYVDESAGQSLLNSLYFDQRYDFARVGRYKFNKKLAISARITGLVADETVVCPTTGEILAVEGEVITPEAALKIENLGIQGVYVKSPVGNRIRVLGNRFVDAIECLPFSREELLDLGINEKVHYPTLMGIIGEYGELNKDDAGLIETLKANLDDLMPHKMTTDDIFAAISYLIGLPYGIGKTDDIDHLSNRRIRSVGELLQNQFRQGMTRLERSIHERMTQQHDSSEIKPATLINTRPVMAAIKEFFGSSQLSQFMDQTNPLSELTHKRRLSALGPGGLNRERATFEVRDVHYSHYGRMCPIETPEGPNIGLINSLSTYAKINEYGFIEAPYRKVDGVNKRIEMGEDCITYITADVEDGKIIAQASEPLVKREDGSVWFAKSRVVARRRDQIIEVDATMVDYMDVSPKQLVSVATAMIPFLENDDANRALMGSNMQRQAVPLLVPEAPVVGTGMEFKAAYDSGVIVKAKHDGVVKSVSSNAVVIKTDSGDETYKLIKFQRSNQGTCINQRPLVSVGQVIKKNDIIADGASTDKGEISLGRNILIGFMTWEGYNYEDAVLISEELVRDDVYTSIHIERYEIEARDTKLGPETITRDIPQVAQTELADLDERGIIRVGAEVHANSILVGKITPKGETDSSPENKLINAIFVDKAKDVRDTSLRVPHGEEGVVIDVKIFNKKNKDELPPGVNEIVRVYVAQKRKISVGDKMAGRHGNKGVISRILPVEDMPFLPDGTPLQIVLNPLGVPSRMNIGQILELHLGLAAKKKGWHIATPVFDGASEEDIERLLCESFKERNRDILVNKYGLSEGLADEILKNTTLDESGRERIITELGEQDGATVADAVAKLLVESGDGKTVLYDGRSGEPFENRVSVGYMYYLKLLHLVDDKMHARSIGPYSLITQQPLGGKAQFGGQRFGEMEVWALEAYGAANTLQEILTIKSDDLDGRKAAYHAIVKGKDVPEPGIPESFKVLIKELQSLALDIRIFDSNGNEVDLDALKTNMAEAQTVDTVPESEAKRVEVEDQEGRYYESTERDGMDENAFGADMTGHDEVDPYIDIWGDSDLPDSELQEHGFSEVDMTDDDPFGDDI